MDRKSRAQGGCKAVGAIAVCPHRVDRGVEGVRGEQHCGEAATVRSGTVTQHDGLEGHAVEQRELVPDGRLVDSTGVCGLDRQRLFEDAALGDDRLNVCGRLHLLSSRHSRWDAARRVVFGVEGATGAKAPAGADGWQDAAEWGIVAGLHILTLQHGAVARAIAIGACGVERGEITHDLGAPSRAF
eukprot:7379955-Prymnesium_polylepis.2